MFDAIGSTYYSYDAAGQLLSEDGPWADDTVNYTYTNRLRAGLSLLQPNADPWAQGYGYDAAKRFKTLSSPAGTFTYGYDGTRHMQVNSLGLPNYAYITNTYDPVARVASTLLKSSANSTLDSALYGYNLAGLRTAVTNAAGTYVLYTNDPIGQLAVAKSSVRSSSVGYFYDAAWNLYQKTNGGYAYNYSFDSNEMTSVGSFDLNGNMTNYGGYLGYTYDDENRLTFISDDTYMEFRTGFVYDGLGRLRQRNEYQWQVDYWAISSTVNYIYDGNRVIQERDGSNNPQVSYTRGPDLSGTLEGAGGIGGLLARSSGYSGGNWTNHDYYHADGNGNITCLVDANQSVVASYQYDPYGNTTSSSGSLAGVNVYQFSSKEFHNNGTLYFYGYRMYDPAMQRWLNRDPIQENGGINLYAFVDNDPLNVVDAVGLIGTPAENIALVLALGEEEAAETIGAAAARAAAAAIAAGAAASGGDRCETRQHGKGERNWQHESDNPWKGWRVDPKDPTKIRGKDPNGKDIVKPRPPDFPDPKPKPQPPKGGAK